MAMLRHLLFCLLASKTTLAACSSNTTFTIRSTADASALANCTEYTGNIALATNTSGIIDLPILQSLNGNLIVHDNPGLTALTAARLSRIDGRLIVKSAPELNALAFPVLSQVTDLVLDSLPKLVELGIDVQNATNIFIGRNPLLRNITLHVKAIHENLTISNNGNDLQDISLPYLAAIDNNFTVGCNTGLVNLNIPALERVENGMRIQGNPPLHVLRIPELQYVGGGLWINASLGYSLNAFNLPKLPTTSQVTVASFPAISQADLATFDCGLATIDTLVAAPIASADSDPRIYHTNTNINTNTDTKFNTGLSTRTKVIIAVAVVVGVAVAVAIAVCRCKVTRKLGKSRAKEEDEEEVITNEEHSMAKNGLKMISTNTAETSLEATLQMTSLGLTDTPKPLRSHKSTNLRPVRLATPIRLATEPPPLDMGFVAAMSGESTNLKGVQNSERGGEELDRRSRSTSRNRLGQELDRADTAYGLEAIEFTNPFSRTKSLKSAKPADERESIIASPTMQVPELARKKTTTQLPRLQLDLRSNSLDSRCISVSSQPPRLQLHLECSSANSSQTSLAENTDCAVAESSSIQRLKPAVVHMKTPSPRMSGGFGAQYGCDPRLGLMKAEAKASKRNSSVCSIFHDGAAIGNRLKEA